MRRLRVKDIFYTLQGEGVHSGKSAWFIRFGGCDIGCVWCDTKDAWNLHNTTVFTPEEIVLKIDKSKSSLVVLTGGEPLYYNLTDLSKLLISEGFQVHLETSGAYPLRAEFDWLCLSPKEIIPAQDEFFVNAHELKIVVASESNLVFAEKQAAKVNDNCVLLLQPEWNNKDEILPMLVDYIKNHPGWRLSLQMHKYIHIP